MKRAATTGTATGTSQVACGHEKGGGIRDGNRDFADGMRPRKGKATTGAATGTSQVACGQEMGGDNRGGNRDFAAGLRP